MIESLERVSYSNLSLLTCPYANFLRYQGGIKTPNSEYTARGIGLHLALEKFHLKQDADLSFLLSIYKDEFNRLITEDEVFISYPRLRKMETEGLDWLKTYYAQMEKGKFPRHPIAIEKEFTLPIAGIEIIGKIDRIDEIDDDLVVSDYKSGNKPTPWFLRHNLQLTAYYYAAKILYGRTPKKLVWWHLKTGEWLETERTDWDIEQLVKNVESAVKMRKADIRHRIYNEKICAQCNYQDICDNKDIEDEILARRSS